MANKSTLTAIEKYIAADLLHRSADPADKHLTAIAADQAHRHLEDVVAATSGATKPLRILVAIDQEKHPALDSAIVLARALHAEIGIVHVIEMVFATNAEFAYGAGDLVEQQRRSGRSLVRVARSRVPAEIATTVFLREGIPADQIIAVAAEWAPDYVIMGTHRRGPLARFFLGSASQAVVKNVHRPVLLVTDIDAAIPPVRTEPLAPTV